MPISPLLLTISSLNSVSRPFRIALRSDITPRGVCVCVCLSKSVCRKRACASVCLSASRLWEHLWLRGRLAVGCWTDNFLVIILMKTTELWIHRATRPVLHAAAAVNKLCQITHKKREIKYVSQINEASRSYFLRLSPRSSLDIECLRVKEN